MRYVRCQSCGSQNKQTDASCYSCRQALKDSTAPSVATPQAAVEAGAVPASLAEIYDIEANDGVVVMRAKQSRRIATGLFISLFGACWLLAVAVIPAAGLQAVLGLLIGGTALFVGLRMALTKVVFRLGRGSLERLRQSPLGLATDDLSRTRLYFWSSSGMRTYRLYLLEPGQNPGPFSAVMGEGFPKACHTEVESWMVGITGLQSLTSR